MENDTEGQVESGEHQQASKSLQQHGDQANLEDVGVKQHQQNDDQVEQGGDVLDTVETKSTRGREIGKGGKKQEGEAISCYSIIQND